MEIVYFSVNILFWMPNCRISLKTYDIYTQIPYLNRENTKIPRIWEISAPVRDMGSDWRQNAYFPIKMPRFSESQDLRFRIPFSH